MITPENPMLMQWKLKESWSTITSCFCLTVGLVFSSDWWVHAILPWHKKEVCLPCDSFSSVTYYEVFNMLDAANGVGELASPWWVWLDLEGKNGALSWPPPTAVFVCWGLNPICKVQWNSRFSHTLLYHTVAWSILECGKRGMTCLRVPWGCYKVFASWKVMLWFSSGRGDLNVSIVSTQSTDLRGKCSGGVKEWYCRPPSYIWKEQSWSMQLHAPGFSDQEG